MSLALRDDLQFIREEVAPQGWMQYVVLDPLRNRFFRLPLHSLIVEQDRITVAPEFEKQFSQAELVRIDNEETARELRQRRVMAASESALMKLLKNYLFFRIHVINPDKLLTQLYPSLRFLFSWAFFSLLTAVFVLAVGGIVSRWSEFVTTFQGFNTTADFVLFGLCLVVLKIWHETGHGLALKHLGARVPSMGIAFLVMWPILYTESTDVWRVPDARKRALVAIAGIYFELIVATICGVLWLFLDDGLLRTICFSLTTTAIVLSLLVNLNPLMRFDGYYLIADLSGVENLQTQAFTIGKQYLRRWLFGIEMPVRLGMSLSKQRSLALYAYAIWIYRFFLFLGIALLVYHLFMKVLGIVLFVVEIWWFIGKPVWHEIRVWRQLTDGKLLGSSAPLRFILVALVLLLVIPVGWHKRAPASLQPQAQPVLVARNGIVSHIAEAPARIGNGELVYEVRNEQLEEEEWSAEARLRTLQRQVEGQTTRTGDAGQLAVLDDALRQARSSLEQATAGLQAQTLRATQDNPLFVPALDYPVAEGDHVSAKALIGFLVDAGKAQVIVYVGESLIQRFDAERDACFVSYARPLHCIDLKNPRTSILSPEEMARLYHLSVNGGEIRSSWGDQGKVETEESIYALFYDVADDELLEVLNIQHGYVAVPTHPESPGWYLLKAIISGLIRELSF